ncbi:MAG: hypothetical protein EA377_11625 [Phycisphaerales bacterium]|nr:MAG: hypothetical protein EA377_11625 [Phycisphaerales bacterium]
MTLTAEKEYQHIGETAGATDHDFDLVHELTRRLETLWRCDQFIANASGKPELQKFWREIKQQEQQNVKRLKELICDEVKEECF